MKLGRLHSKLDLSNPQVFFIRNSGISWEILLPQPPHFFNTGFLLKELNKTLVVLIPKVECPTMVSHYKPISLCNVSYKIISKAIVNRLRHVMDSIVTPFQSAFIKGRLISDNIILESELFETIKKKKTGKGILGALKLDMDKADDRLSWRFI